MTEIIPLYAANIYFGQHPLNKVAPSNCRKDNVTKKLLQNKAVKMSLPKM